MFTFLSKEKAIQCAKKLPDGVYISFPVATRRYISIWGKKSGPMGRVHGLIINKEKGIATVYHASIDQGRVASEPFEQYVLAPGSRLFRGYKIYQIDRQYKLNSSDINQEKIDEIMSCEQSLL